MQTLGLFDPSQVYFVFFFLSFHEKNRKWKKTTTTTKQAKKRKRKWKKRLIEGNQERKLIYKQNCKGSTSEQVSKISTITTPTIPLLESLKSGPYGPQDLGLTQRHLETFKTKLSVYWKEKHFNVCWTPSANFNCSEQCETGLTSWYCCNIKSTESYQRRINLNVEEQHLINVSNTPHCLWKLDRRT